MDDGSDDRPGRRRTWLLPMAALATAVWIALLVTACGAGPSPAASATAGSREQAALAYARCMRAHGVPDFPDPDSNGDFHLSSSQQAGGSKASRNGDSNGPESGSISGQEQTANQVCNHLLDAGTQMSPAQTQHALGQLVKYAQCMRAHGIPAFPDPHTTSGTIGVPGGISFDLSGIDVKSPQFGSATHVCEPLAAHAKG